MPRKALIKIRRGLEAQLPVLDVGELGFCTDTNKLYIGTPSGNQLLVAAQSVGDMLKSIYDTDNDGKVNSAETADSVPWSGVTDKPETFPPSSHDHDERYIKNTGDTITGGDLRMDGGSVNYIRPETSSGWARGFWWSKRDLTRIGGIGVLGSGETINKFYIGYGVSPWQGSIVEIFSDSVNINGTIKQQGNEVWHKGKPLTWNDLKGV